MNVVPALLLMLLIPLTLSAAELPALPPSSASSASAAPSVPSPAVSAPAQAGAASGALAPLRPQAIELLKQGCPARVDRLLRLAAPEALEDTALAAEICLCSDVALEQAPETTPVDSLPEVASTATLTCAQPGVVARNQALTRRQFGDHLAAQGLTERQTEHFSRCLAEGYWQASFAAVLQGRRTQLSGPALWSDCADQVGRPNTPLPPRPTPARLPTNEPSGALLPQPASGAGSAR